MYISLMFCGELLVNATDKSSVLSVDKVIVKFEHFSLFIFIVFVHFNIFIFMFCKDAKEKCSNYYTIACCNSATDLIHFKSFSFVCRIRALQNAIVQ